MNSGIDGVNLETDSDTGISSSMEVHPSVPATPDNLESSHVDCRVCAEGREWLIYSSNMFVERHL